MGQTMARGFFIWVSSALLGCTLLLPLAVNAAADFEMQLPQVFLEGIAYDLTVSSPAADPTATSQPTPLLRVDDFPYAPSRSDGEWVFSDVTVPSTGAAVVSLEIAGEVVEQVEVPVIPAWVSILPPLVAIGMALLVSHRYPQHQQTILSIVISTTVLFELFGPLCTRFALRRSVNSHPS